ncbi:MAG: diaminopimelate epimerase [Phycisphaerae bacterium]|jgi:diaminopimelate epimerase|nr:diaminopimelate epimerase [Phycisphaerae bacterium]
MRFTKMQGAGNDYVYVDCFDEQVDDPEALARVISDRHFGVGGDGLILVMPSESADVRMRMFNSDGSEGEMCGNGIRCVAKYTWDHARSDANPLKVETMSGVKTIDLVLGSDNKVTGATVDMGEPILDPPSIPVNIPLERVVDMPIRAGKKAFAMTCVSMGNPHAVIFVDDVAGIVLKDLGRELETNALFPERINVHFVQVHSENEVTVRTWERGTGHTLACGTGASAVCVAGVLSLKTGRKITAHLDGGDLELEWRESDEHVYMTGPADEVFTGQWNG